MPDMDSIVGVVRADLGEVSRQAVCAVLRTLSTVGLVRRFQPSGSMVRYEALQGRTPAGCVGRAIGSTPPV